MTDTKKVKMVNIALPKGRLGDKVYDMFEKAGFECPSIREKNRKLVFENPDAGVRYFWVKPSDVAIYVERGAADIGVVGKDILMEARSNVYELLDLNVAREFYAASGTDIDIIHLNGSIELAPILGLSDVIVDLVETGTTLRENHLEVVEEIAKISARLIANKSSFKFKTKQIETITQKLEEIIE